MSRMRLAVLGSTGSIGTNTLDVAAREIFADLTAAGITRTPDGARYSITTIRAALCGWER